LSLTRFYEIRQKFLAFNVRDLQVVGVALEWAQSTGVDADELLSVAKLLPHFMELEHLGYFDAYPSLEQAKAIKQFEKMLPKELRKEARAMRYANMKSGPVPYRR